MSPMLATAYGNGPYRPVIVYRGEAFQVGQAFAEMVDALQVAIDVAAGIRDGMRSPSYKEYLARLR